MLNFKLVRGYLILAVRFFFIYILNYIDLYIGFYKNFTRFIIQTKTTKMKIYTSYYGNAKKLKSAGIVPIAISVGKPRFFSGMQLQDVAPTWEMVALGKRDLKEDYQKLYLDKLSKVDLPQLFSDLSKKVDGKDCALLCFEALKTDGEWCHRTMLADYAKQFGIEMTEFKPAEQLSAFD